MSWFGTIKLFAVAVVVPRHTSYRLVLFATQSQSHEKL